MIVSKKTDAVLVTRARMMIVVSLKPSLTLRKVNSVNTVLVNNDAFAKNDIDDLDIS